MNRLVLCVEGRGDVEAAPILVSRLLAELPDEHQGVLFLDTKPLEVGAVHQLTGRRRDEWPRYLEIAKRRPRLGAVLLLLDGDEGKVEGEPFCATRLGRTLAERARNTGAGRIYSAAVVFIRQEFESLLIASYPTLDGNRPDVTRPKNPEEAPRGAKEWLADHLDGGYKETQDQGRLTRALDLGLVRSQNLLSFRRLEHALQELAAAVRSGQHVSSPWPPPAEAETPG